MGLEYILLARLLKVGVKMKTVLTLFLVKKGSYDVDCKGSFLIKFLPWQTTKKIEME